MNIKICMEYLPQKRYLKFFEKSTQFNRTYGITYIPVHVHTCTYVEKILNQLPSVGLAQAHPS